MKTTRLIPILLTVVAALVACTKQEKEKFAVEVSGTTTLTADLESLTLGSSKEALQWDKGDYIGVFGSTKGDNERYVLNRDGYKISSATFYGPNVKGDASSAYFPYISSMQGSAAAIPFNLEPEQQYVAGNDAAAQFLKYCNTAYAFAGAGETFKFQYPFGLVDIQLQFPDPVIVKSVKLSSSDTTLAGSGVCQAGNKLAFSSAASKYIRLDCGDGVSSKSGNGWTDFLLVIPPANYRQLTLTLEIEGEGAYSCALANLVVARVTEASYPLTTVAVTVGGIEGFTISDGYLEED